MKFQPLSNRVLVKREEVTATPGGLYIPSSDYMTVQRGEVLAVGKGAVTMQGEVIPMEVQAGDVVMFNKGAGVEIDVEGESYLLFHETDLMGILR